MVHGGWRARRSRRARERTRGKDSRLAAAFKTQIDLYRRSAFLRRSGDWARAYLLCTRRDDDGQAFLVRTEPSKYPRAQRGRPENPPGFYRAREPKARLGGLFADR